MTRIPPTFDAERALLLDGCELVAGVDEVGRGAWAGPVSVGVAVVTAAAMSGFPEGVRDSKQLSARARDALAGPLSRACHAYAVGHASNAECDALGMTAAQRLATARALAQLDELPDALIVDGRHEYTGVAGACAIVGADTSSCVVAAASVLAKVTRDRLMVGYAPDHPGYGFEANKGYASIGHRRAVALLGLTDLHRRSWSVAPLGAPGPGPVGSVPDPPPRVVGTRL